MAWIFSLPYKKPSGSCNKFPAGKHRVRRNPIGYLKAWQVWLMAEVTTIFQEIWRQGQVPQDFKDATIVHLSLLNFAKKIFVRILLNHLTKAFDSVNRDGLWKLMQKFGCPERFTHMVRQLHDGMTARVTDNGTVSEAFAVTSGVKQGCVLAPILFSLRYADGPYHDERPGIRIAYRTGGHLLNSRRIQAPTRVSMTTVHDLIFTDDCALNTVTEEDMQRSMDLFAAGCATFGLTINTAKTMVINKPPPIVEYNDIKININGAQLNNWKPLLICHTHPGCTPPIPKLCNNNHTKSTSATPASNFMTAVNPTPTDHSVDATDTFLPSPPLALLAATNNTCTTPATAVATSDYLPPATSTTTVDPSTSDWDSPEVSRTIIPPPAGRPAPADGHNYVKVQFNRSPYMSTYLVAMVIGNLEYVSAKDVHGVDIRVFTPPGRKSCGEYALEVSLKTLPFYANLFGQKFPLPKCDLVAIPDFAFNAMENWGLITYRETALLIDQENTSLMSKQRVALTVAHELAHMWFGNLVTMEWWTHLWLNEGFATWIEYFAVDYCFPDYDIWTLFVSREYAHALRMDELKMSHPIEIDVYNPDEVEEIFDAVSYQKGASVIRMLNDYLGAEVFRAGLQLYIKRHQYSNTVTTDLWRALAEVSGQPVQEIMSTWTKQAGHPVLSVRLLPSADNQSLRLGIRQSRFLAEGGKEGSLNCCASLSHITLS
ncbi:unnamed protein product [Schistocephalus solidus]|uniref:Reverse transcriptase domain-containing protein n=1 Tax=Schistocephalus solidus TaxID=70667 RepID=A0A183T3X5_SCHSO|nr:unnamed protein product [Schistocephalus solidus]